MLLIDLQLALFIALLALGGGVAGLWLGLRHLIRRPPHPQQAVARVRAELPFGLALLNGAGTVVATNAVARQLLHGLDGQSAQPEAEALPLFGAAPDGNQPSSGLIAHPLPLRWWRYPLGGRDSLLLLSDRSEQQSLLRQQQDFIGQISHELRTPLTSLVAHLAIVRSPLSDEALRDASLRTIERETQRLVRLVRDLLELYRLETTADFPLQPTNIVLVAEAAISQIFPRAEERGVILTLRNAPRLPRVLAHPDRLTQVFLNLLANAITYSRAGDSVTVALEAVPEGVRCRVADTGPGIAPSDLPHVTEPLYRGRMDVEGSGIGLAVAREILRRHGATLEITSSTMPGRSGTLCTWLIRASGQGAK